MALRDRAVDALRLVFGAEREERSTADSPSVAAAMATSPSMFSVWGREDIGGLLTVSQSLMDRFADYEAMEEYPDINCAAEGQRVYAVEGSVITPVPIEQVVMGDATTKILAYDVKKKWLVAVTPEDARMTGRDIEVLEIPLSNGSLLRVTAEHKLLTLKGYVDAKDVSAGDELISMWAGFEPAGTTMLINPQPGVVTITGDPKSGGKARVFDITTSTHNFVLEGAVVHNSAYHYYANDATQPSIKDNRTIWCASDNAALKGIGDDLLHKKLRVEDEIWSQAYSLGMYGNNYDELLITQNGVIGLNHLPVPTVRRVERLDGGLIGFVQDVTGQFTANSHELRKMLAGQSEIPKSLALFEDWQVIHMRLRATRRRSPYGVSVAEGGRWIWKRLTMMEDAVMIYKLTRAPARYAFYVDVTDLPSDRVEGYLRKMKRDFKKKKMVNPRTGRMDMRYSPLCLAADTKIPLLDGTEQALEAMAAAHERGEEQWVYSVDVTDGNKLKPGKVVWAGKTRTDAQLLRVTLDNGKSVKVTPDHKMIRRSGELAEAQNLKVGDSLMPFRQRVSSKKYGDSIDGYEMTYCPLNKKMLYTHRVVAESERGKVVGDGQVTHHENFNKRDNDPTNLRVMPWDDHLALHRRLGHHNSIYKLLMADADLERRTRKAAGEALTRYNKSPEKRAKTSQQNRERDTAQYIRAFNEKTWNDPVLRERQSGTMRVKFPPVFVEGLRALIYENPQLSQRALLGLVPDALVDVLDNANTRSVRRLYPQMLTKVAMAAGYESWNDFHDVAVDDNHKVTKIEWLEKCEDTYTLTIEPAHTFAISAGVFVKNSNDEDFVIAVREGRELARVEVLSGPDYQCLTAGTRIPLLDGSSPTIKELCERGGEHWLYSSTEDGKIVPGRGHSVHMSSPDAEIWEVGLDNGEIVECTWHHPFLTRDGSWVFARDLKEGDSLMPLYQRTTSKKDGDRLDGYEKVYDPASDSWVYTHQMVYDGVNEDKGWVKGTVIHHEGGKGNNHPDKLKRLTRSEHSRVHLENVKRLHSPEVSEKRRATLQSTEHREKMSQIWKDSSEERKEAHRRRMVKRMSDPTERQRKAEALAEWNKSEDHKERVRGEKNNRWRGDIKVVNDLIRVVDTTGARTMRQMMKCAKLSQRVIEGILRASGVTWAEFAAENIPDWKPRGMAACSKTPNYLKQESATPGNHKVLFARKTDRREPVYDITVDGTHCFAVGQGVFVHNTVDDVEYFKKMLHGALRVPREYLGQDGGIPSKSILSNEDVRAARVTLNLQREIRIAYERIIRVHLAARGVRDPWAPEFQVEMTIPSGIYEMAAYEVLNARADYASRVQPFTSTRWIQEEVLKLSNADIEMIEKQRKEEAGDEQSGDVPSYAGGQGAGGAPPMPEEGPPPEQDQGEGPSDAEMEQGAPEVRTQAAARSVDYRRRLEEWRYKQSCRRHDEIKNMMGALTEATSNKFDPGFAERQAERQSFFKDLRGLVLSQQGGGTRPAPQRAGTRPRPRRRRRVGS